MPDPFIIGVISDTHGLLRPAALDRLRGAHHILHAGDIGKPGIIEALGDLAPITAIRGNIDRAPWATVFPETDTLRLAGLTIHIVHDLADLRPEILAGDLDVVVSGHSHRARFEWRRGVLFLNPGSAGPRRFTLPVTVATLTLAQSEVVPQVHHLTE